MGKYTTYGDVRGTCGHTHRSVRTAEECLRRDRYDCRAAGGYSDRGVYRVIDGYLYDDGIGDYVYPSHGRSTGAVRA